MNNLDRQTANRGVMSVVRFLLIGQFQSQARCFTVKRLNNLKTFSVYMTYFLPAHYTQEHMSKFSSIRAFISAIK